MEMLVSSSMRSWFARSFYAASADLVLVVITYIPAARYLRPLHLLHHRTPLEGIVTRQEPREFSLEQTFCAGTSKPLTTSWRNRSSCQRFRMVQRLTWLL